MKKFHKIKILKFFFLFFLILVPSLINASQNEMDFFRLEEMLIQSATKTQLHQSEAPASTTILSRQDIEKFGWRDLPDALQTLPGVFLFSDRIYHFLVPRGFYLSNDPNSRVLLLLDDHAMIEPFGYYNGHIPSIDINFIERIEIIRGPGSVAHGTNAMLGVINIVPLILTDGHSVKMIKEIGNFGYDKYALGYGYRNPNWKIFVQSMYEKSNYETLYFPAYNHKDYQSDGLSYPENNALYLHNHFFKINWKDLYLSGFWSDRKKNVPTGIYGGQFNQNHTFFSDQNGFIEIGINHKINELLSIKIRSFADHYKFTGEYYYYPDTTWTTGPPYSQENNNIQTLSFGGEISTTIHWNKDHTSLLGMEYRKYQKINFAYYSVADPNKYLDEKYSFTDYQDIGAFYASHRWQLFEKLFIEGGAHGDYYESVGTHINIRASTGYEILQKTWLKLIYSDAFRAPNVWEQRGGFYIKGNLDLKPETISMEEIALFHQGKIWVGQVGLYHYQVKNVIEVNNTSNTYQNNPDMISGIGADIEAKIQFKSWNVFANFSTAKVQKLPRMSIAQGNDMTFAPWFTGKAGIAKSHAKGSLSFDGLWIGPRRYSDSAQGKMPQTVLLNFSMQHQFHKYIIFHLRILNLQDKDYAHPSFVGDLASYNQNAAHPVYEIPASGRTLQFRTTLKF